MSEMVSEQDRRVAQEKAIKEAAILESIPEYIARLENLREVYGPGGDAGRQYAQLKTTLQQLDAMRIKLEARCGKLDGEIAVADKKFKDLCRQVGTLSETSIVINGDSVKDDVFSATQQLGKLQKSREAVGVSLDQCLDDIRNAEQELDKLSQQRSGKVSTALLLAAHLNEVLTSIEDVNEINYQPVIDPTLPVDEYNARVQDQPRNVSTINWASSIFDDAMQQAEANSNAKFREAASDSGASVGDEVWAGDGLSGDLMPSSQMLSMLQGNEG